MAVAAGVWLAVGLTGVAGAGAAGAAVAMAPASVPQSPSAVEVQVVRVVDGDTIRVLDGNREIEVRLIGIDTPERDECGFDAATQRLQALLEPGETVTLVASGGARDDTDRYGRSLRYVEEGASGDAGEIMIREGYAIARYDSQDGYGQHDRETTYRSLDGDAAVTGCDRERDDEPAPAPAPEPTPEPTPDVDVDVPEPDVDLRRPTGFVPPAGWTTDALTPGYTGCRQGYPGGKIDGVYVWKPIPC